MICKNTLNSTIFYALHEIIIIVEVSKLAKQLQFDDLPVDARVAFPLLPDSMLGHFNSIFVSSSFFSFVLILLLLLRLQQLLFVCACNIPVNSRFLNWRLLFPLPIMLIYTALLRRSQIHSLKRSAKRECRCRGTASLGVIFVIVICRWTMTARRKTH